MVAPRTRVVKLALLGGFLGAGKTTMVTQLALKAERRGLRPAIITNDQAANLVDTASSSSLGITTREVAGACLCCHFNQFVDELRSLTADTFPDIIFAEPVGSCTDIVATVVRPLQQLFSAHVEVAPYFVLLGPEMGSDFCDGLLVESEMLSTYIFAKQLEEADCIVLSKLDTLSAELDSRLVRLASSIAPGTPLTRASAVTGDGLESILDVLLSQTHDSLTDMEVDYDRYAAAEAELAWLNLRARATASFPFCANSLTTAIAEYIHESCRTEGNWISHLKVSAGSEGALCVANAVSHRTPKLSRLMIDKVASADIIVNARAIGSPDDMKRIVLKSLAIVEDRLDVSVAVNEVRAFRPGRPVPVHRVRARK